MKTIRTSLKFTVKAFLFLIVALIIWFNYSLYYEPSFKANTSNKIVYNQQVYHQLKHLKSELKDGAGQQMQELFPEGFIFINVLYGLSWAELITNLPQEAARYQEGIKEINWAIKEMNQPAAKRIFPKELPLVHGAFYRGWTNYLLGKKLGLQHAATRDSTEIKKFINTCKEISNAVNKKQSPFLESYVNMKWPADGVIAVTSLKLHDELFQTNQYENLLDNWLTKVKSNLDEHTGLIPHSIEAYDDQIIEGARGCSQSLILVFLNEIDSTFSKKQFQKYKEHFLDWRMGMPGIREYPKGNTGHGDIDSGPVILEIGGAASIVGQRTMGIHGDWTNYKALRNCIETFGVGWTLNSRKKYIFGQLPMADAFIAWSNSLEKSEIKLKGRAWWRVKTHLLSLLLLVLLGFLIRKL